ncbi:MAG: M60 family metallopeptidase [Planctomycetota bacterium]
MRARTWVALAAIAVVASSAPGAGDAATDVADLLADVSAIAAPGTPGAVCAVGPDAFPVVCGATRDGILEPVVAATRWGRGRVVAFGHGGYLGAATLEHDGTARLLDNCVRWAAGRPQRDEGRAITVAVVGLPDTASLIGEWGYDVARRGRDFPGRLDDADVLLLRAPALATDDDLAAVARFVRGGGGLVIASTGWGWAQLNRSRDLPTDHPGNRLLAAAGIVWTGATLRRTTEDGYDARTAPPADCQASRALARLRGDAADDPDERDPVDARQAGATITRAVRSLPPDDELLRPTLRSIARELAEDAVPTPERPLRADDALARVVVAFEHERSRRDPADRVRPHPAAAAFPGSVPAGARRPSATVDVDVGVPGWHGTARYAAPGAVVTVTIPDDAVGLGLRLRIGAHKDRLWDKPAWKRVPEISRTTPLDADVVRTASPFGGLVYVDVPQGIESRTVAVRVEGAVPAPTFVRGRTDPVEWRRRIRRRPAPWAELATDNVVLTVPSSTVRDLDDPGTLLAFWDDVLDGAAELAARPTRRTRPERIVADVQISAGYMHAGYPIMTHLDAAERMVSVERLRAGEAWGLFHELGHNHQGRDWTFAGTGEVTCNLFSMYLMETLCDEPHGHGAIRPEKIRSSTRAYLDGGADFAQWKRKPFLALAMYIQVKDAFGWDVFRRVFAEYRALADDERPRTDDEKRDQWLVRLSRATGRNLGPFFTAWGVPTSDAARSSIADLPGWMPEGFPPPTE